MSRLPPGLSLAIEYAGEQIAEEIVFEGGQQAISTMESMLVNAGQEAAFVSYVLPAFEDSIAFALSSEEYEWNDVDAGPYVDFLGDTVEEGNMIAGGACLLAQLIEAASDEISGIEDGDNGLLSIFSSASEYADELDDDEGNLF